MKSFTGKTLRWEWRDGVIELTLDREPANEIGTAMLAELEKFVTAIPALAQVHVTTMRSCGHKSARRNSARCSRKRARDGSPRGERRSRCSAKPA